MNSLIKTTVLAVSLSLVGVAHANVKAEWPSFNRVDQNRDGFIDEQEAQSAQNLSDFNLGSADSDRDGKVNRSEYTTAMHLNNNPEDSIGAGSNAGSQGSGPGNTGGSRNAGSTGAGGTSGNPATESVPESSR